MIMTNGVLTKLRALLPDLSPALSRIAGYAVQYPDRVLYHTVTELAEASGSSEGSVIRFCHDIGFSGFQDFKLALAIDLSNSPTATAALSDDQGEEDLVNSVLSHTATAIQETGLLLDREAMDTVAHRIRAARRVDIFGVGASGIIARYFHYKLVRLGLVAQALEDPHLAAMSAASLDDTCVAIGISSSGSIIDTVHTLQVAKQAGAFTIAVTNRPKSPLTAWADAILVASNPESPLTGGDVASKIGQLVLLDVLFSVIIYQDKERTAAIQATAAAVVEKSY
jgi:RpiR family carbohydrate utilization transcriptional regulator